MLKRGLFVGRFQPMHHGHLASIKWCLKIVDELIIAIGSSDKSFEFKNPFTAGERIEMIRETIFREVTDKALQKIILIPVPDIGVHRLWTYNVDLLVPRYNTVFTNDPFTTMLFKERRIEINHPEIIKRNQLSATEVRYRIANDKNWQELVSAHTAEIIIEVNGVERIKNLDKMKQQYIHH